VNNKRLISFVLVLVIVSVSCSSITSVSGTETPPEVTPITETLEEATPTKVPPLVASGNGPQGFSAEATSADSVRLSWEKVEGATSYHVVVSTNEGEALNVIDLPLSVTSYEDFLAAPESQLTYAVEAIGDSDSLGKSITSLTTPARQPNPLIVMAEYNDSAAVTKMIGAEGGSLSLNAEDGLYELTIPPVALDADTEIKLVPITDLSDWPLDGHMIGAVGIEPEGLPLNVPASLKITPAGGIPDSGLARVGFSFDGYGSEFALSPLAHDMTGASTNGGGHRASLRLQSGFADAVMEWFTNIRSTGAGEASSGEVAQLARENQPSDAARALEQKRAAAEAADDELVPLQSEKAMNITRWFEYTRREIAGASDCFQLKAAMEHFESDLHVMETNGKSIDPIEREVLKNVNWDELVDRAKETIDEAAENCEKKSGQGGKQVGGVTCTESLLRNIEHGSTSFYKELQKRMLDRHGSQQLSDARGKIDNYCSTGYVMSGGGGGMKVPYALICNINQPFTATGNVQGGSITLTFTPNLASNPSELPAGGSSTYSGAGTGFSLAGEGTFTLTGSPGGPIKLNASGPGTVDEYGGSGDEAYILAPREHSCATP